MLPQEESESAPYPASCGLLVGSEGEKLLLCMGLSLTDEGSETRTKGSLLREGTLFIQRKGALFRRNVFLPVQIPKIRESPGSSTAQVLFGSAERIHLRAIDISKESEIPRLLATGKLTRQSRLVWKAVDVLFLESKPSTSTQTSGSISRFKKALWQRLLLIIVVVAE